MRFLLLLFVFLSCINTDQKKDSFLIMESKLGSNKPFPVIVFGTEDYSVKYGYSRNFKVSQKRMEDLQNCVYKYCDTFIVAEYPNYQITSISPQRSRIFFINNLDHAKLFFKSLDNICNKNELIEAHEVINQVLLKLDTY